MPDKLRDMEQLFTMEAAKYNVFPLDDPRLAVLRRETKLHAGPDRVHLFGRVEQRAVSGYGRRAGSARRAYTITADIEIPQGGAEGMLVTDGGHFGGYGFYLLKGSPSSRGT